MSAAAKKGRKVAPRKKSAKAETVLLLRTCRPGGKCCAQNHGGPDFFWPTKGKVAAPDWNPNAVCGGGLHGLLWGAGKTSLLDWSPGALWLVVEALASEVVEITEDGGGKVKVPRGTVVYAGNLDGAAELIQSRAPTGIFVTGGTATAGDNGTATAGYYGKATAGDNGTATAGDNGTATAGNNGTATAGYYGKAAAGDNGTATAGDNGTATAGYNGTATAGNNGTATAGYYGTATAGNNGTATAGYYGKATAGNNGTATAGYYGKATAGNNGTATAGDNGTATAGYYGKATAGNNGRIAVDWWDVKASRMRWAFGYVGEDGIEANTAYVVKDGKLVKAVSP